MYTFETLFQALSKLFITIGLQTSLTLVLQAKTATAQFLVTLYKLSYTKIHFKKVFIHAFIFDLPLVHNTADPEDW